MIYPIIFQIVLTILLCYWFIAPFFKHFQTHVLEGEFFEATYYADSFYNRSYHFGSFLGFVALHYLAWPFVILIASFFWPALFAFLLIVFIYFKFIKK